MTGAVMNYDFGPKRHWRRWVWNRIAERLTVSARDAVCLYLPGVRDFDRAVAVAKGFRAENLIGIERNQEALFSLRTGGVLTIEGSFSDCVFAAAKNRRVDLVFGDFCQGLTPALAVDAFIWNCHPHMQNAVFAFNLMRGRDPQSNSIRKLFEGSAGKHRGKTLFLAMLTWALRKAVQGDPSYEFNDADWIAVLEHTLADHSTYKSTSGQVFDSVVWRGLFAGQDGGEEIMALKDIRAIHKRHAHLSAADRSFAAVWAHRTRRMNA